MQFSFTNSCCYCYTDELLEQVLSVIRKTGSLKKISFTAHSLGGLIARYTISVLYSSDALHKDLNDGYKTGNPENLESSSKLGSIGGLEPISFITLGTPHLGFIGKKQVNSSFLVAQVKRAWLNGAGAGVIAHVADSLKQQEVSRTLIAANL
ncbi:hypothetical protein BHM03_00002710 [Ensete ventricosum]|nr:hypothetical protein BHM03_00002710 [Ensete ventricosum]